MAQEIREDSSDGVIEVYPEVCISRGSYPVSATVALYSPGGTVLQAAAAATVDAPDCTITTATTATQWTLSDSTEVEPHRPYLLVARGIAQPLELDRIAGSDVVYLLDSPHDAGQAADRIRGWRVSYSPSSTATADRYTHCRAVWTVTLADASVHAVTSVWHIVYQPWSQVCSVSDVQRILAQWGQSQRVVLTAGDLRRIAARVDAGLRAGIENHQRYGHLYWDPAMFQEAALAGIPVTLAREWGRIHPAASRDNYEAHLSRIVADYEQELSRALARVGVYDADDDKALDAGETQPLAIRLVL